MGVDAFFTALCAPGPITPLGGGSVLGLFLAGLAGGVIHCGPMCGPFVLGQVSARMSALPAASLCERHRLRMALSLPYHLGRLSTYGVLGALAGGIGAGIGRLPFLAWVSSALLLLAALAFALQATRRFLPAGSPRPGGWGAIVAGRIARLAARCATGNGLLLGVLLGFLPCGLLYAALTAALATQTALGGALLLLAFGLGTIPALFGVGLLGQGLWRRLGTGLGGRLSPAVLALNALLLGLIALQRLGV